MLNQIPCLLHQSINYIYSIEANLIHNYQTMVPYHYIYPLIKCSKLLTKHYSYYLYFLTIAAYEPWLFLKVWLGFILIRRINSYIKVNIKQLRPYNAYPEQIRFYKRQKFSYSFPSQSVQSLTYIYSVIHRLYPNPYISLYFYGILLMLALTRTYRGLHYPHDIIISYLSSIIFSKYLFT